MSQVHPSPCQHSSILNAVQPSFLPLQKHSYNYYDGSNPAHVPDTKSSSLRKKKFSEPKDKDKEAAEGDQQPKKKPSFSRYPGKSKVNNYSHFSVDFHLW